MRLVVDDRRVLAAYLGDVLITDPSRQQVLVESLAELAYSDEVVASDVADLLRQFDIARVELSMPVYLIRIGDTAVPPKLRELVEPGSRAASSRDRAASRRRSAPSALHGPPLMGTSKSYGGGGGRPSVTPAAAARHLPGRPDDADLVDALRPLLQDLGWNNDEQPPEPASLPVGMPIRIRPRPVVVAEGRPAAAEALRAAGEAGQGGGGRGVGGRERASLQSAAVPSWPASPCATVTPPLSRELGLDLAELSALDSFDQRNCILDTVIEAASMEEAEARRAAVNASSPCCSPALPTRSRPSASLITECVFQIWLTEVGQALRESRAAAARRSAPNVRCGPAKSQAAPNSA